MEVRLSETFVSLQGEGPSAGEPATFLRLQGCGVGCHWCDTKYSWPAEGGSITTSERLWAELSNSRAPSLLVITGGEPLEHPDIRSLLEQAVEHRPRVEVETSGLAPPPLSHPRLAYNVSPKLPSATQRWADTWRHIPSWVAEPRATFKLVVGDAPDPDDAARLIAEHRLPRERVMLMPEGMTDADLRRRSLALAELCVRNGWRLSPRLHIWMWGARRGV